MSLRYIDVLPSNISTTANAGYSQGSPLVQFVIGAQDAFLLGSTIRLNGHYEIDGSNSANAQWEPSLGIYNVLEQLIIASNKTNQTIEHIRNYNRFLSSYTKVTSSEADLLGHMNMTSLTTTTETQCLKFDGTAFDFSIPLPCGLFLGRNPIPLAAQWGTKGLNITLHLAPDSNVFFSTSGYTGNNSVYKLKKFASDRRGAGAAAGPALEADEPDRQLVRVQLHLQLLRGDQQQLRHDQPESRAAAGAGGVRQLRHLEPHQQLHTERYGYLRHQAAQ